MTSGFQCFNSSGGLQFQLTDYLARILGKIQVVGANGNGSFTDPNLTTGTPWALFFSDGTGSILVPCAVTVSGSVIYWTYGGQYANTGINPSGFILYGVN